MRVVDIRVERGIDGRSCASTCSAKSKAYCDIVLLCLGVPALKMTIALLLVMSLRLIGDGRSARLYATLSVQKYKIEVWFDDGRNSILYTSARQCYSGILTRLEAYMTDSV